MPGDRNQILCHASTIQVFSVFMIIVLGVIVGSIQRELLVEDVVDLWNNNKCNYSHSSTNSSNVVTIKYTDNVQE